MLSATAVALVTVTSIGVAVGQRPDRDAGDIAVRPVMLVQPSGGDLGWVYRARGLETFSRSAVRVTLTPKPDVVDRLFRIAPLNLWPAPREKGGPLAVLPSGGRVAVTGVERSGFAQILYDGRVRWVHRRYLAAKLPTPQPSPQPSRAPSPHRSSGGAPAPARPATVPAHSPAHSSAHSSAGSSAPAGVSSAPCPDGSGIESGLTPSAVRMFRAVCNAFPALRTYGGYAPRGEHADGKAVDFMINGSPSLGRAVADWARANAARLDLYDVIYARRIWTPARSAEGWRLMPDRGSPTANHEDHVHIKVN